MWLDRFRQQEGQTQAAAAPVLPRYGDPERATRFKLEVPVTFKGDGCIYEGQCVNVSETGLLARCDPPPELWTDGELFLEAGEHYLNVNARVARMLGNDVGFAFSIDTENDRAAIAFLMDFVQDRPFGEDTA